MRRFIALITPLMLIGTRYCAGAVVGAEYSVARPILQRYVEEFRADHVDGKQLQLPSWDEAHFAELFGRGQCELLLSLGPLEFGMQSVIAHSSPDGNFIKWEQADVARVRVIAVVNEANPIQSLRVDQVQRLLSAKWGLKMTWDDLGSKGGLVTCYGESEQSLSRRILRDRVMRFENIETPEPNLTRGARYSGWYPFRDNFALCGDAQEVLDEIARDRNGIGFLTFAETLPKGIKLLPVSANKDAASVAPMLDRSTHPDDPLSESIIVHLHPKASSSTREFYQWLVRRPGNASATKPANQ